MKQPIARNRIIVGDALNVLRTLPDESVDMIFTSPPYYNLRDYGIGKRRSELGQEASIDQWADNLTAVAREAWRVLVPTGSLWLNVGDTYSPGARHGAERKSLLLGPQRLALRLVRGGWLLRNWIIWAKRNHLPSPVADRLTPAHEALLMLTKQGNYYFDLNVIRVPHTSAPPPAPSRSRRTAGTGPKNRTDSRRPGDTLLGSKGLKAMRTQGRVGHLRGKNPGDVWQFNTSQYRGAHRATMPVELARRAIAAACPELRCTICRRPWRREQVREVGHAALRPTCLCEADVERGIVLDPFMGSGTTAVAAEQLGRDWLGIELNPDYAAEAMERIKAERDASPERNEEI